MLRTGGDILHPDVDAIAAADSHRLQRSEKDFEES